MKGVTRLGVLLALLGLGGCGGAPRYGCPVGEGISCSPVSDIYAAVMAGGLTRGSASPEAPVSGEAADAGGPVAASGPRTVVATVTPGAPVLTRPEQLRVWVRRWEDAEGDLHDETYLFLRLDEGRWSLP